MLAPSLPKNEKERLAALKQLNLLDSPPDEAFDDFTFLASNICNSPISIITLLDETRQWFKSKVGIEASETPREISFCGHTILGDDIFEVTDALSDERFMGNPLVIGEPKIRFYAGIPIKTKEGFNLGTLCVIDSVPKKLTDTQRNALRSLSRQVTTQIELQRTSKKNEALNQTLSESVRFSKNMIDNIPAMIGYWDKNLICKYANKTYAERYKKLGIKIVGKELTEVLNDELMQQIKPHVNAVLNGVTQRFETHVTDPGQQCLFFQVNYIPDFDDTGIAKGFYIFALDITALRQAEEERKLAGIAIETANTAVLIADSNHYIISVNDEFSRITGYSQEELVGKHPTFLFNEKATEDAINTLSKERFWRGESTYRKKNGGVGYHFAAAAVLTDQHGNVTHHVATITDLSEKKKIEQELVIMQQMLERTGKVANIGGWEYDIRTGNLNWTDQVYAIHEMDQKIPPSFDYAISTFYIEESRVVLEASIQNCVNDGTPFDLELVLLTAKGNHIWVRKIATAVIENGVITKVAGAIQDITDKKTHEKNMLDKEQSLRKSVIREVHHHIKNNIQGLSGILHNSLHAHPELTIPINETIGQLESVAVIHGLQGKNWEADIEILELTQAIAQNIGRIWRTQIIFEDPKQWVHCNLSKTEAVPIALILGELMTNASKHGLKDTPIRVSATQTSSEKGLYAVDIDIKNEGEFSPSPLPSNTENYGLRLVSSLMPKSGAYFYISTREYQTNARLSLKYPVIKSPKQFAQTH